MLRKRIIVCLDVQDGRVVKGVSFEGLREMGNPVELAARYETEGADEIVFLDISATTERRRTLLDVVRRTAEKLTIPLTVGGGINSLEDIAAALRAGADKVSINTAAVQRPELIADADFAVLLEPTDARVEGGCKGTLRAEVSTKGLAAHSARPWKGHNAIHDAGEVLARLVAYEPRTRVVDDLEFREALNAVLVSGGVATNVIPDRCVVTVNYRYAPSLTEADAEAHVREVFAGFDVEVVDNAGGARPGLHLPAARAFVEALGMPVEAKQGWTDVARFSAMGVPAVNFGPGDPTLAHTKQEQVRVVEIRRVAEVLRSLLSG